jgi:tetratricopeptide (TPR) repeat protein
MKLHTFILAILSFGTIAIAQPKTTASGVPLKDTSIYNLERSVYKNALKYSDLTVAKDAVYKMMAINPSDKSLRDTLLYLYFSGGSFGQCVLLSRELLAENPSRSNILEVKAVSEQNLGLVKEALESYEKLYATSKNLFHLYQVSVLQYQLKRYGECNNNIETILKDEKSMAEKVSINVGQASQEVSLKAAALNIRGVMLLEGKRDEEAKKCFEEALKIQPDFDLAKNNFTLTQKKSTTAPSTAPVKKPAAK